MGNKQQGSPICDQYNVQVLPDRTFVCVADGCNWGERPRDAARIAAMSFVRHELQNAPTAAGTRESGRMLLRAMQAAHNGIVKSKSDIWEAGTTTLIGGFVARLVPAGAGDAEYGVFLLSIGDCKCFLWDCRTRKVRDITIDNRGNLLDATDPGGRLGPYNGPGLPDTRNLTLFFERCHQDDVIVLCSDGVHDNLDPSSLGVDAEQLDAAFAGLSWDDACKQDYDLAARVKRDFSAQRLADIINGKGACFQSDFGFDASRAAAAVEDGSTDTMPALENICKDVTDYCLRVTTSSRHFMETTKEKLPKDYKRYPGKMDHTTCVAIRIRVSADGPCPCVASVATPAQDPVPPPPVDQAAPPPPTAAAQQQQAPPPAVVAPPVVAAAAAIPPPPAAADAGTGTPSLLPARQTTPQTKPLPTPTPAQQASSVSIAPPPSLPAQAIVATSPAATPRAPRPAQPPAPEVPPPPVVAAPPPAAAPEVAVQPPPPACVPTTTAAAAPVAPPPVPPQ